MYVAAGFRGVIESCDVRLAVAGSAVCRCWVGRVVSPFDRRLLAFVCDCQPSHVVGYICAAGLQELEADLIFNSSQ